MSTSKLRFWIIYLLFSIVSFAEIELWWDSGPSNYCMNSWCWVYFGARDTVGSTLEVTAYNSGTYMGSTTQLVTGDANGNPYPVWLAAEGALSTIGINNLYATARHPGDTYMKTIANNVKSATPYGTIDSWQTIDNVLATLNLSRGSELALKGWAVQSTTGIGADEISLYIDNIYKISAQRFRERRADVSTGYNKPNWLNSGWSLSYVLPSSMTLGQHTATVKARDNANNEQTLGCFNFYVYENLPSVVLSNRNTSNAVAIDVPFALSASLSDPENKLARVDFSLCDPSGKWSHKTPEVWAQPSVLLDKSCNNSSSSFVRVFYNFPFSGKWKIRATVKRSDGVAVYSDFQGKELTVVANQKPTASLTVTEVYENGVYLLKCNASGSVDVDGNIQMYKWRDSKGWIYYTTTPTCNICIGKPENACVYLTVIDNQGATGYASYYSGSLAFPSPESLSLAEAPLVIDQSVSLSAQDYSAFFVQANEIPSIFYVTCDQGPGWVSALEFRRSYNNSLVEMMNTPGACAYYVTSPGEYYIKVKVTQDGVYQLRVRRFLWQNSRIAQAVAPISMSSSDHTITLPLKTTATLPIGYNLKSATLPLGYDINIDNDGLVELPTDLMGLGQNPPEYPLVAYYSGNASYSEGTNSINFKPLFPTPKPLGMITHVNGHTYSETPITLQAGSYIDIQGWRTIALPRSKVDKIQIYLDSTMHALNERDGVPYDGTPGTSSDPNVGWKVWGFLPETLSPGMHSLKVGLLVGDYEYPLSTVVPFSIPGAAGITPNTPSGISVTGISADAVEISWAPQHESPTIDFYEIRLGDSELFHADSNYYTIGGLKLNASYSICVRSHNLGGNYSAWSSPVVVTNTGDLKEPTIPTDLQYYSKTSSSITLCWKSSFDRSGVVAYEVFRNSVMVGTVGEISFIDQGLLPDTNYLYSVRAVDSSGLRSNLSDELLVRTNVDTNLDQDGDGVPNYYEEKITGSPTGLTVPDTENQIDQNIHRP